MDYERNGHEQSSIRGLMYVDDVDTTTRDLQRECVQCVLTIIRLRVPARAVYAPNNGLIN